MTGVFTVQRHKTYKGYIAEFTTDADGLWRWDITNALLPGSRAYTLDTLTLEDLNEFRGTESREDRLARGWFESVHEAVTAFVAFVDELTMFDEPDGLAKPHAGEFLVQLTPQEHLAFAQRAAHYGVPVEELASKLLRRHLTDDEGYDLEVSKAQLDQQRDEMYQAIGQGNAEPPVVSDHVLDTVAFPDIPGLVPHDDPITAQPRVEDLVREGDIDEAIRVFRKLRNASWSNLQKAARALLNEDHDAFSTANVEASSKSHIRTLKNKTRLSFAELSKRIDDLAEGNAPSSSTSRRVQVRVASMSPPSFVELDGQAFRVSPRTWKSVWGTVLEAIAENYGSEGIEACLALHGRQGQPYVVRDRSALPSWGQQYAVEFAPGVFANATLNSHTVKRLLKQLADQLGASLVFEETPS